MPLHEYGKKREFDQTPEPGADAGARPAGLAGPVFCIQRHDARRLHFDLRMESGGTLKSWAVPEGPTLDPTIKRLAVMVEDHPMQYATFEGNIPKGNYGAGSMMLWDLGEFEVLEGKPAAQQLERGDFKFRLRGQKLRGDFALVRLKNSVKGNEWLLLKKKDAVAQVGWTTVALEWSVATGRTQDEIAHEMPARSLGTPAKMPKKIVPMLAHLAAEPPRGADWMYELKWDGVRAVCFFAGGQVRFDSRKSTPIERQYPELQAMAGLLKCDSAILDGEIAALDDAGRPRFQRIQPRIMATDASAIQQLTRSNPVVFFAFDLLYCNGRDLRSMPLRDRRRLLAAIAEPSGVFRVSESLEGDAAEILQVVRAQELEGIVAKDLRSLYEPSRSKSWLKVKANREQEFVICGYTEGQREHFGAMALGCYDGKRLHWAGNVGTGFDIKTMKMLRGKMDPLAVKKCPFPVRPDFTEPVQWLKPELVCSVRYLEWLTTGRFRSPVYLGLRPDIDPGECLMESAVTPAQAVARPPLIAGATGEVVATIETQRLKFTNVNKVYYPADNVLKKDVINYYDAVADLLIPHWKDRPLSLRRYPEGITHEGFFQKHAAEGFPAWVRRETVLAENDEPRLQAIGQGRAELLFLTNLGCIDQNPWMSRVETLDRPDFMLIDLDPFECHYDRIVEAAHVVRRKLEFLELVGYPKTTGGHGMHIYVPLEPIYGYEQTKAISEILARVCATERPDLFTLPRNVKGRERDRVYFDFLQNGRGKTISAPYVLRPRPGATVATPLEWREVKPGLQPGDFHIRNAMARFDRVGDLFSGVLHQPQRLEKVIEKLDALVRSAQK